MRYLLLLGDDPDDLAALAPDDRMRIVRAHLALVEELRAEGRLVTSAALDPRAASVLGPDGGLVSDGPFAETKEALGGFYVVDVPDEEEARAVAARMPRSPGLQVLLVPVVEV